MTIPVDQVPRTKDKPLFTPGPLTTSLSVKQAMLRDLGSRDKVFIATIQRVRDQLLEVAGLSADQGYEVVLMQGSGTFGIESVLGSTVPPDGKLLVVINGAYGRRIAKIADVLKIETTKLQYPDNTIPDPADVDDKLAEDPTLTNVATVHCETTTGILNPIEEIGRVADRHNRVYFVDSMSAFGGAAFDFKASRIDYLVSSSNKCIEGVPGFSFVICRRESLLKTEGWARSLSLDLLAQWQGLESNGQFHFTPPTHTILAFEQALRELRKEGGVEGRAVRYRANYETIAEGMRQMGFVEYLPKQLQGHVITTFRYPDHPNFCFNTFYQHLLDRGHVIYPGKVATADCFRIGHIERLFPHDMKALLAAIGDTLEVMGIKQARHSKSMSF